MNDSRRSQPEDEILHFLNKVFVATERIEPQRSQRILVHSLIKGLINKNSRCKPHLAKNRNAAFR